MDETPTTELDAVNVLLGTIGSASIQSLTGPINADVSIARSIIREKNREVQSIGWHFNSEYDYPITPDSVTQEIAVPSNVLSLDLTQDNEWDVTVRGTRLYSKKKRTYQFGTATLFADVKLFLPFEEIPECARRFITIAAARVFQNRVVGDSALAAFSQDDLMSAKVALDNEEGESADHNIFDSYDAYKIIDRNNGVIG